MENRHARRLLVYIELRKFMVFCVILRKTTGLAEGFSSIFSDISQEFV